MLAACREGGALPPEEEVELVLLDGAGQRVGWGTIRPVSGGFLESSTSLTSKDGSTWSGSEDPSPNVEPSIRFDVPVRSRTLELRLGGRAARRIDLVAGLVPDEFEVLVCALLHGH